MVSLFLKRIWEKDLPGVVNPPHFYLIINSQITLLLKDSR